MQYMYFARARAKFCERNGRIRPYRSIDHRIRRMNEISGETPLPFASERKESRHGFAIVTTAADIILQPCDIMSGSSARSSRVARYPALEIPHLASRESRRTCLVLPSARSPFRVPRARVLFNRPFYRVRTALPLETWPAFWKRAGISISI